MKGPIEIEQSSSRRNVGLIRISLMLTVRDAILTRKRGKIFNKIKLTMKVGGTCDIKLHDRDL